MGPDKGDIVADLAPARAQGLPGDQRLGHRAGPPGGIGGRCPVPRIRRRQRQGHRGPILGPCGGCEGKGQQPGGQHVAHESHHFPVSPPRAPGAIHKLGKIAKPR